MGTAYVYDPIYLAHDLPNHPENAHRLRHVWRRLEDRGPLSRLTALHPRAATTEELLRVHTADHIARVRRLAEAGGGSLDADTYVAPRSFDAALMAAGGVVRLVEAVLAGEVDNGFALVRPPGHHATPARGMGFCLFNNVAVAARAALTSEEVARILIVDFDVHHGNGTQDIFEADPSVFYVSTHQYPYYPGTGHWREMGQGAGKGRVLNVPLPPGVGDVGYERIFSELVWPVAEQFAPDLLLVSAGYDAHWDDPLAHMNLSLTGYARLAHTLVRMADQMCEGRVAFALEGGYHYEVLSFGVLNAFYALLGDDRIIDPLGASPHEECSIDDLLAHLRARKLTF